MSFLTTVLISLHMNVFISWAITLYLGNSLCNGYFRKKILHRLKFSGRTWHTSGLRNAMIASTARVGWCLPTPAPQNHQMNPARLKFLTKSNTLAAENWSPITFMIKCVGNGWSFYFVLFVWKTLLMLYKHSSCVTTGVQTINFNGFV